MPVFINEVTAEIPPPPVAEVQAQPLEDRASATQPEYELMLTLSILEERRQRLEFD